MSGGAADVTDDDALLRIYNRELMALAAAAAVPKILPHPDARATAMSAVCGSAVTVELMLDGDVVTDFGYKADACSLTKAVVAIMARAAVGKTAGDMRAAAADLRAMLAGDAPAPGGDWADLKILTPVVGYTSRHDTVMLPFAAVEKAFAKGDKNSG